MKEIFNIILHFMAPQNFVTEYYERDFDMIFHFMAAKKKSVAEHYELGF